MTVEKTLEPMVRQLLSELAPAETLSTAALAMAIDPTDTQHVARQLVRLADAVPGLCDRVTETATKGYMKGKKVRRCIWHHIASPDMPVETAGIAHIVPNRFRASANNHHLANQSFGAASSGMSLADRVAALELDNAEIRSKLDALSIL